MNPTRPERAASVSKVSVIIPAYNSAGFITDALDSVRNQTHRDLEIIIVDDGSTDDTREVLEPYLKDPSTRYIHQDNSGPSAARNTGIKAATGRYIAFLDADDSLLERSVERRADFLDRHPRVTAVFTNFYAHQDPDHPATTGHYVDEGFPRGVEVAIGQREGAEIVFNERFFEQWVEKRIGMWPGSLMLRRDDQGRIELYREDLVCGDITEYAYRISKRYVIGYIDEPLFNYNNYRSVLTADRIQGVPGYIKVLTDLMEELESEPADWSRLLRLLRRQTAYLHLELGYHHFNEGSHEQAREIFRKCMSLSWRPYRARLLFLLSFLPREQIGRLRRIKRRLGA